MHQGVQNTMKRLMCFMHALMWMWACYLHKKFPADIKSTWRNKQQLVQYNDIYAFKFFF